MLVRKLDFTTYDEALTAFQIRSAAFHDSTRYEKTLRQIDEAEKENLPLGDPAVGDPPVVPWGAFIDDTLVAVASSIDFLMRYENQDVRMSGIQGVATRPEYRRRGAVRLLLEKILRADRERGHVFSYLHPFSYAYYRQFGYGYGSRRIRTVIPIRLFREFVQQGTARLARPDDLAAIKDIYTRFIARTNGPISRGEDRWKQLWEKDPFISGNLPYILYDEQGMPGAYLILQDREKPDPSGVKKLLVGDWGCRKPDDLKEIFAFMNNFASEYDVVEILLPMHYQAETFFGEIVSLKRSLETFGQVRLLDVKSALVHYRKPYLLNDFRFSLQVVDAFMPENFGTYIVETSAQGNDVRYQPDRNAGFDIKLDIGALSSLLYGSTSLRELEINGQLTFSQRMDHGTKEYLKTYFQGRDTAIYDHF